MCTQVGTPVAACIQSLGAKVITADPSPCLAPLTPSERGRAYLPGFWPGTLEYGTASTALR